MEENNPYGCSYADLFEGGLTIYTTLDTTLQDKAEAACDAQRTRMSSELDTALVAIDPKTGQVKAMVGGGDYKSSQVNIATGTGGSGRQAGSTFKAFTLAAAIERHLAENPHRLHLTDDKKRLTVKNNPSRISRTLTTASEASSAQPPCRRIPDTYAFPKKLDKLPLTTWLNDLE